jgi:hypothetical protein
MKYAPKRNKENGRWDFTITEDTGGTRPFGYCMDNFKEKKVTGHHATPHDAVCCFIDFVIENGLEFHGTLIMMQKCVKCGEQTMNAVMRDNQLFLVLCRNHATKDIVKEIVTEQMSFEVIPELAEDPTDPTPEVNLDIPGAFHEAVRARSK